MKTIFRILIIVVVIGVISLGIYWVVERGNNSLTAAISQENSMQFGDFQRGDHVERFNGIQPLDRARTSGAIPEGFADRGHDDFRGGIFGLFGILRSLGIIAITTLVVIQVQKRTANRKRRKNLQAAA